MKITQGLLSEGVLSLDFVGKYNLGPYISRDEPAVFFGCYAHMPKGRVYRRIMNHKGLAIIVWCGSDILLIPRQRLQQIKSRKNIKHVAIGQYIAVDLDKVGIKYKRLPLLPNHLEPDPQPLGDSIYSYLPSKSESQRRFYGGLLIDELKRRLPKEKFIFAHWGKYTRPQLREIYKQCFIGLRLTKHDGLSNTVLELGVMGRMCLYNDRTVPNAIPWVGIPDIVQKIIEEKKFIGQTKIDIAHATCNFLNISDDWLDTKFWK